MPTQITLFHTMDSNIALYDQACRDTGSDIRVRHVVSDDLIQRATEAGALTDDIRRDAAGQMTAAMVADAVTLCTCSTIGPAADDLARDGHNVLRTDRALADQVFQAPGRVAILVAAPSTVVPTTELFHAAAQAGAGAGAGADFDIILVSGAWEKFNEGDATGYARCIADAADACAGRFDRVALAQASMAPARQMMQSDIETHTSPAAGMRAAIATAQAAPGRL